ncbi:MAG: hypothetical protein PHH00_01660 [Candidatus Nanoarchaeia archaeon]|nr:hypothetical protein [Candidatus Nanoarchaeia archaeon]
MNPSPLFIPVYFQEERDDKIVLYCTKRVNEKNVRFIEYYNKEGLLERVNVWGICGERLEYADGLKRAGIENDHFVAYDKIIDSKTIEAIAGSSAKMYPKSIRSEPFKLTFFNAVFN